MHTIETEMNHTVFRLINLVVARLRRADCTLDYPAAN